MTAKERIDIINQIEQKVAVDKIQYRDIKLWPLIRLILTFYKPIQKLSTFKNYNPQSKTLHVKRLHQVIQGLEALVRQNKPLYINQVDSIFFIDGKSQNELINGKYEERILFSLSHYCPEKYITFTHNNQYKSLSNHDLSIDSLLFKARIKALFRYKTKFEEPKILGLKKLNRFIHESNLTPAIPAKLIFKYVTLIDAVRTEFTPLLKKIQPKNIFLKTYYSPLKMGLILAAHDLNIQTIEVQHGLSADFHYMLSNWKNFPKEGYKLIPNMFWCWGKMTSEIINDWAKNSSNHKTIISGNPWLTYLQDITVPIDHYSLLDKLYASKKCKVLVTLQTIEAFDESCLVDAISSSPDDMIWLLRLHPLKKNDLEAYKKRLNTIPKDKYDFDYTNDNSLYSIFKDVTHHVSFWSTTIIEAITLEIPTIIIHENGFNALKDYIDQTSLFYCTKHLDLLRTIAQHNRPVSNQKASFLISTGKKEIQKAYNALK